MYGDDSDTLGVKAPFAKKKKNEKALRVFLSIFARSILRGTLKDVLANLTVKMFEDAPVRVEDCELIYDEIIFLISMLV